DRQQLLEVAHEERVEERLVGVLQLAQEGVALEIGLEAAQYLEPARHLLVERADMRRQEAVQMEEVALGLSKGRALVGQRPVKELIPAEHAVLRAMWVRSSPDAALFHRARAPSG